MENYSNQNMGQGSANQPAMNQPTLKQRKQIPSWIGFVIIAISIIILFGGVFAYQYFFVKPQIADLPSQSQQAMAGWKTYTNSEYGLEFKYPNILAIKSSDKGFSLLHSVPFYHSDPCNLKDGAYIDSITDFSVVATIKDAGVNNVLRAENYYGLEFDSTGKPIINNKNGLKEAKMGNLTGYLFAMGVEGCGADVYYFPFNNKTLVLQDRWVGEFALVNGHQGQYGNLQGIILPEKHDLIFNQIISTFKFTPQIPVVNQNPKDYKHISAHIETMGHETVCENMIWPEVINIYDKNVLSKIEQVLSFKNITGITKQEDCGGFTGSDYQINYDKNNVLSISFFTSWEGAYPSEATINYVINLVSGEIVKPSDIFYQNKISDLVNLLNIKLQANIQQKSDFSRQQNPSGQGSQCSEQTVNDGLQTGKEYDPNYGKFTEQNLIASNNLNGQTPQYSSLKITSNGIEFIYDFGFAHVIQACEPNGVVVLTYNQLKGYIRPDGLLSNEVK